MKKVISMITVAVFIVILLCALGSWGNRQWFDTTYTFNQAIINLPDGTIVSGKVDSWKDFDDGDQIQVVIEGVTYLIHSSNIVLINK